MTAIFIVFDGYFFGNFRQDIHDITRDIQPLVGFSVITLNDPEQLFHVKFW